jgi:hypothetical protein
LIVFVIQIARGSKDGGNQGDQDGGDQDGGDQDGDQDGGSLGSGGGGSGTGGHSGGSSGSGGSGGSGSSGGSGGSAGSGWSGTLTIKHTQGHSGIVGLAFTGLTMGGSGVVPINMDRNDIQTLQVQAPSGAFNVSLTIPSNRVVNSWRVFDASSTLTGHLTYNITPTSGSPRIEFNMAMPAPQF